MRLSDEVIYALSDAHRGHRFRTADEEGVQFDKHDLLDFARAIESAARDAALEGAAKACINEHVEAEETSEAEDRAYNLACNHCADAIRAMKEPT